MGDMICPECGQKHLRTHTILVPSKAGDGLCNVHYEWECLWCGHHEGDYETVAEAVESYTKRIGGKSNE